MWAITTSIIDRRKTTSLGPITTCLLIITPASTTMRTSLMEPKECHHTTGSEPTNRRKKAVPRRELELFHHRSTGQIQATRGRLDNLEMHCANMNATMNSLEMQVGKIAQSFKGKNNESFLSDTEPNPR